MKEAWQAYMSRIAQEHIPHNNFVRRWKTESLKREWAGFLNYMGNRLGGWEWYGTFTFREAIHPESADKAYRIWYGLLNRAALGEHNTEWSWRLFSIRALEWQKRGVLHYHALIGGGVSDLHRVQWCKYWEQIDATRHGMARIYKFDSNGGAEQYCSKYVTKGGNIDLTMTPYQRTLVADPTLERLRD
jgi:hypothetical protein